MVHISLSLLHVYCTVMQKTMKYLYKFYFLQEIISSYSYSVGARFGPMDLALGFSPNRGKKAFWLSSNASILVSGR